MIPLFTPMPLVRRREPFDHPEWIFELKYDGFRAFSVPVNAPSSSHVTATSSAASSTSRMRSTARSASKRSSTARLSLSTATGARNFCDLMFGRGGDPVFVAFDVLRVGPRDVRPLSLVERKKILRRMISRRSAFALYADAIDGRGRDLSAAVRARDLEGIVAKWKVAPYRPDVAPSSWIKIKNPEYSQARDRAELFER